MLAVDTNVVVRLMVVDDDRQARRALSLFAENRIFVSNTVLLETEWVLRSIYGLQRDRVHSHLMELAGLPQVTLGSPERIASALEWFGSGMDFADALHLAGAEHCSEFATFDRKLTVAAKKAGAGKIRVL